MSPRYPPPAAYSVHLLPVHIALNKAVVFFITPLGEIFIYYRVLSALNKDVPTPPCWGYVTTHATDVNNSRTMKRAPTAQVGQRDYHR